MLQGTKAVKSRFLKNQEQDVNKWLFRENALQKQQSLKIYRIFSNKNPRVNKRPRTLEKAPRSDRRPPRWDKISNKRPSTF